MLEKFIANTNSSVNNTSINLIPPSIKEESSEPEKFENVYPAQQDVKEEVPLLNSDQWKKETTLSLGDLMLAGLTEVKFSRSKRIEVRCFPGGKIENLQYHVMTYLKKKPDNIIIHFGNNDSKT